MSIYEILTGYLLIRIKGKLAILDKSNYKISLYSPKKVDMSAFNPLYDLDQYYALDEDTLIKLRKSNYMFTLSDVLIMFDMTNYPSARIKIPDSNTLVRVLESIRTGDMMHDLYYAGLLSECNYTGSSKESSWNRIWSSDGDSADDLKYVNYNGSIGSPSSSTKCYLLSMIDIRGLRLERINGVQVIDLNAFKKF